MKKENVGSTLAFLGKKLAEQRTKLSIDPGNDKLTWGASDKEADPLINHVIDPV